MIKTRGRHARSMGAILLLMAAAQAQVEPALREAAVQQEPGAEQDAKHGTANELILDVESDLDEVGSLLAKAAAGKRNEASAEQGKSVAQLLQDSVDAGRRARRGIEELLQLAEQDSCAMGGT